MTDEGTAGEAELVPDVSEDPVLTEEASSFTSSSATGTQTASLEIRKQEQKAYVETKKLEEAHAQNEHERQQLARDNDVRRKKDWWLFCLVIGALAGGLVIGIGLMILGGDTESRRRGESLVFLVIGALAGYVTGSRIAP